MPIAGAENNGNHDGVASIMPRQRAEHFLFIAIVGRKEISADEKEDDLVAFDVLINLSRELSSRTNTSIMPNVDDSLALEKRKLRLDLVAQCFVGVRIGKKDVGHTAPQ
ncbi:chaperone protein DnaK [Rhodopseudomonas palustris]|nr:chaperone protein DnaK [Rhodopseudomonas palustris]